MAINLWIPRIEYNDLFVMGDIASGSDIITNLDIDVNAITVGMYVTGNGIPDGTKVLDKTTDTIILDTPATDDIVENNLDFFKRFDFVFPPAKDTNVKYKPKNTIIDSLSGVRQIQTNYVEATRDLEHWFISKTAADILEQQFYLNWACMGNQFRYFPDKDDSNFITVALNSPMDFDKNRQVKKHPDFLYKISTNLRWVQSVPIPILDHMLTEDGDTIVTEDGDAIGL